MCVDLCLYHSAATLLVSICLDLYVLISVFYHSAATLLVSLCVDLYVLIYVFTTLLPLSCHSAATLRG
jgi:hypothetical protein